MRYAARRDASHAVIRDALRAMGFLVHDTAGVWDLTVCDRATGRVWLVDAKSRSGPKSKAEAKKTAAQEKMLEAGWAIAFVYDVDEAIELAQRWRK